MTTVRKGGVPMDPFNSRMWNKWAVFGFRLSFFAWCVWLLWTTKGGVKQMFYVTNWAVGLASCYSAIASYKSWKAHFKRDGGFSFSVGGDDGFGAGSTPNAGCIASLLFESCLPLACTVVGLYWTLVFPTELGLTTYGYFLSINKHAVILVWVFVEYVINNIAFVALHVVFPLCVTISYLFVNYGLAQDNFVVYAAVTWKDVVSFVYAGMGLLTVTSFFLIAVALQKYRQALRSRLFWWAKDRNDALTLPLTAAAAP